MLTSISKLKSKKFLHSRGTHYTPYIRRKYLLKINTIPLSFHRVHQTSRNQLKKQQGNSISLRQYLDFALSFDDFTCKRTDTCHCSKKVFNPRRVQFHCVFILFLGRNHELKMTRIISKRGLSWTCSHFLKLLLWEEMIYKFIVSFAIECIN